MRPRQIIIEIKNGTVLAIICTAAGLFFELGKYIAQIIKGLF